MPWVGGRGRVLIKFVAVMNETHAARRLSAIDQLAFTPLHQRKQKRNGESKAEVKRKGKAFPVHAMKAYRGRRGISALILKIGNRRECKVDFTPWKLYPRARTPVPIQ
jgi:hypothetical protein